MSKSFTVKSNDVVNCIPGEIMNKNHDTGKFSTNKIRDKVCIFGYRT